MEYIDQNINELKVNFIKGEFDYNTLKVLEEKELDCDDYLIKAAVIGASHAISFINKETNKVVFTEVVANYVHSASVLDFKSFNKNIFINTKDIFNHNYVFRTDVINGDTIDGLKKIKTFYKKNKIKSGLNIKYSFAPKKLEDRYSAETLICIKYDKNTKKLIIKTLHSYPNNLRALETTTIIKLEKNIKGHDMDISIKDLFDKLKDKENISQSDLLNIIYEIKTGKKILEIEEENIGEDDKDKQIKDDIISSLEEMLKSLKEAKEKVEQTYEEEKVEEKVNEGLKDIQSKIEKIGDKVKKTVIDIQKNINSKETKKSLKDIEKGFNQLFKNIFK